MAVGLSGCVASLPWDTPSSAQTVPTSQADLLQQSWQSYRRRFIQRDGRVIDREANDRTVSEGQAYAMLRAVLVDDRATFDRTLNWAENNLQRSGVGEAQDTLWAWKWGKSDRGKWEVIDGNFASDGDLDAITALILASRRWNRPEYLDLARTKLNDLWEHSTIEVQQNGQSTRYFLPGPKAAFAKPDRIYLNPSYLAPYAFRLFAQVDPSHDWESLIDSSYRVLSDSAQLSAQGLPSDWVMLDPQTGIQATPAADRLKSQYGFDAYRVWWRVAIDAAWFKEPRAQQYLQQSLTSLQTQWRSNQFIAAEISLTGQPLVDYDSTAQYAMLHSAAQIVDPQFAAELYEQKLLPNYQNGFWDNNSAYYTQNLAWFGIFPFAEVDRAWLQPQ